MSLRYWKESLVGISRNQLSVIIIIIPQSHKGLTKVQCSIYEISKMKKNKQIAGEHSQSTNPRQGQNLAGDSFSRGMKHMGHRF